MRLTSTSFFFFFNDTATTEIYTLSLHDALPICSFGHGLAELRHDHVHRSSPFYAARLKARFTSARSEEHTSELQSLRHLVCRLLLEKKKKKGFYMSTTQRSPLPLPPKSASKTPP